MGSWSPDIFFFGGDMRHSASSRRDSISLLESLTIQRSEVSSARVLAIDIEKEKLSLLV